MHQIFKKLYSKDYLFIHLSAIKREKRVIDLRIAKKKIIILHEPVSILKQVFDKEILQIFTVNPVLFIFIPYFTNISHSF